MPRNVEVKARVADLDALRRRVESMSDTPVEILEDTPLLRSCLRTWKSARPIA